LDLPEQAPRKSARTRLWKKRKDFTPGGEEEKALVSDSKDGPFALLLNRLNWNERLRHPAFRNSKGPASETHQKKKKNDSRKREM